MKTTRMGKDFCPNCKELLDCASSAGSDHIPVPGDITVCLYCQRWLEFSSDMALIRLSDIRIRTLPAETIQKLNAITYLLKQK